MMYKLQVRSTARRETPLAEVHHRLFQTWTAEIPEGPWSLPQVPAVPVLFRGSTLTGRDFFIRGKEAETARPARVEARIYYALREQHLPPNRGLGDDWMTFSFRPDPATHALLLTRLIPLILRSLDPYLLTLGDERFADPVPEPDGSLRIGAPRACGCDIEPVFYLDRRTLQRRFQLDPETAATRLEGIAEQVHLFPEGLYVIGSMQALDFEPALTLARTLESHLRPPRRTLWQRLLGR